NYKYGVFIQAHSFLTVYDLRHIFVEPIDHAGKQGAWFFDRSIACNACLRTVVLTTMWCFLPAISVLVIQAVHGARQFGMRQYGRHKEKKGGILVCFDEF